MPLGWQPRRPSNHRSHGWGSRRRPGPAAPRRPGSAPPGPRPRPGRRPRSQCRQTSPHGTYSRFGSTRRRSRARCHAAGQPLRPRRCRGRHRTVRRRTGSRSARVPAPRAPMWAPRWASISARSRAATRTSPEPHSTRAARVSWVGWPQAFHRAPPSHAQPSPAVQRRPCRLDREPTGPRRMGPTMRPWCPRRRNRRIPRRQRR